MSARYDISFRGCGALVRTYMAACVLFAGCAEGVHGPSTSPDTAGAGQQDALTAPQPCAFLLTADGPNAARLTELTRYVQDRLSQEPSSDEQHLASVFERLDGPKAYTQMLRWCRDYNFWFNQRRGRQPCEGSAGPTTARRDEFQVEQAIARLSATHQVNSLGVLGVALARAHPVFELMQPLTTDAYPDSAIGDSTFAMVTDDYAESMRRVAAAWKHWIVDADAPIDATRVHQAMLAARFQATSYVQGHSMEYRDFDLTYSMLMRVLVASRLIVQRHNQTVRPEHCALYGYDALQAPALNGAMLPYSDLGVDAAHAATRHELGQDYHYIRPQGFEDAVTLVAQLLRGLLAEPPGSASMAHLQRLAHLTYVLANLAPYAPPGNWGLMYPLVQLLLQRAGLDTRQSTGLDLWMMVSESKEIATPIFMAWLQGASAADPTCAPTLVELTYQYAPGQPLNNPFFRHIDRRYW
jgi:hypothetical protein